MKVCSKCGIEKDEVEFYVQKGNKDGLKTHCKDCHKKYDKQYKKDNEKQISEDNKKRYQENKEEIKINNQKNKEKRSIYSKQNYIDNREYKIKRINQYQIKNREKVLASKRQRYADNKQEISAKRKQRREDNKNKGIVREKKQRTQEDKQKENQSRSNRLKNNVNFKLTANLRSRLSIAIKGDWKTGSAVADLGCTVAECKEYLESLWQPGMSWDNWTRDGWHIDHVVPLSSFDLLDPQQLKKACHYTNLQPLWAKDNLSKGAKIPTPQQ